MKAAIREHRASYIGTYTSIYSRIISQADRSFDIFLMTKRSIKYGKDIFQITRMSNIIIEHTNI